MKRHLERLDKSKDDPKVKRSKQTPKNKSNIKQEEGKMANCEEKVMEIRSNLEFHEPFGEIMKNDITKYIPRGPGGTRSLSERLLKKTNKISNNSCCFHNVYLIFL